MPNCEVRLITNIKLKCALFEVRTVIVRHQLEQAFSFRFESIVRGHSVLCAYKRCFDNRIKPVPNSEYVFISEMHLTCGYGIIPYPSESNYSTPLFIWTPIFSYKLEISTCWTLLYESDPAHSVYSHRLSG